MTSINSVWRQYLLFLMFEYKLTFTYLLIECFALALTRSWALNFDFGQVRNFFSRRIFFHWHVGYLLHCSNKTSNSLYHCHCKSIFWWLVKWDFPSFCQFLQTISKRKGILFIINTKIGTNKSVKKRREKYKTFNIVSFVVISCLLWTIIQGIIVQKLIFDLLKLQEIDCLLCYSLIGMTRVQPICCGYDSSRF